MPLPTTTIGAYPKPDYVPTPDWFRTGMAAEAPTAAYDRFLDSAPDELEELHDRATREVVAVQVAAGIDIPTDGEVRRENYIHYQCRNFDGIDFTRLTRRTLRGGSWVADVPTIVGPIRAREPTLVRDYRIAQGATERPVKMTLPGPLTILDSTANVHYPDDATTGADLARALNEEVLALVDSGCAWIQIDEPAFARRPGDALEYGFANLELCFDVVPEHVERVVHVCCGYPEGLDRVDAEKADPDAYFRLAPGLRDSSLTAVSIEDAHRRNDPELLEHFGDKTVILGSVDIAASRVESEEEITAHLTRALEHIDTRRLMVAPDCGLGMLGPDLARAKLRSLTAAARSIRAAG